MDYKPPKYRTFEIKERGKTRLITPVSLGRKKQDSNKNGPGCAEISGAVIIEP